MESEVQKIKNEIRKHTSEMEMLDNDYKEQTTKLCQFKEEIKKLDDQKQISLKNLKTLNVKHEEKKEKLECAKECCERTMKAYQDNCECLENLKKEIE